MYVRNGSKDLAKKKPEPIADRKIKGKHLEPIWLSSGDNY